MNRTLILTSRNLKEMKRDPISLIFCIGLPLALLIFMQLIFGNVKEGGAVMFEINNFAPAIANFGYTFVMLYVSLIISGDKDSAFANRIAISPVKPIEYLLSFIFSTLPVALIQTVLFYAVALIFGFELNWYSLLSVLVLLIPAIFYCTCGILVGVIGKNEKQCGPICSLFITASGMLGGIWMPIEIMGGTFFEICKLLPFYNGVKIGTYTCAGQLSSILLPILWVMGYTIAVFTIATLIYNKGKKTNNF